MEQTLRKYLKLMEENPKAVLVLPETSERPYISTPTGNQVVSVKTANRLTPHLVFCGKGKIQYKHPKHR